MGLPVVVEQLLVDVVADGFALTAAGLRRHRMRWSPAAGAAAHQLADLPAQGRSRVTP
ncbi:MAG: hypothetical protein ACRDTT_12140 [Pseudonocardiaceae bacterium]